MVLAMKHSESSFIYFLYSHKIVVVNLSSHHHQHTPSILYTYVWKWSQYEKNLLNISFFVFGCISSYVRIWLHMFDPWVFGKWFIAVKKFSFIFLFYEMAFCFRFNSNVLFCSILFVLFISFHFVPFSSDIKEKRVKRWILAFLRTNDAIFQLHQAMNSISRWARPFIAGDSMTLTCTCWKPRRQPSSVK